MMWRIGKTMLAGLLLAGAGVLGGCTDYGRGYGQVGLGYGAGGYYDNFYRPGFAGLGGGYGWYGDYYYPGSGYYVYDRGGRRHRWNNDQRRYWEGRREARRDFRQGRAQDRRAFRAERRGDRAALRRGEVTREQFRADRRADRQGFRAERRSDRQQFRAERRGVRSGNGSLVGSRAFTPRGQRGPRGPRPN